MLYFLVLPIFLLWLAGAGLAVAVCRWARRFRPAFPFAWRMALWASLGFLSANALLILSVVLGLGIAERAPAGAGQVLGNLSAVGALVGPPLISGAGWLLGLLVGAILAVRQRRVAPNNSSKPTPLRGAA